MGGATPTNLQQLRRRTAVDRLARHLATQSTGRPPRPIPITRHPHQPQKLSQRLTDESVRAILEAYEAGATIREVGKRFGLAHSSINKLLKQDGIKLRRRGPRAGGS